MAYALDELARDLRAFQAHSTAHRRSTAPLWEPGTPAALEAEALGAGGTKTLGELIGVVELRLSAAEDLLAGAGTVLAGEAGLMWSLYPLVRSAAEFSARAAWLVEPDLTPRQRAGRLVAERLYSLGEQANLPIPGAKEEAAAKKRKIRAEAQRAGVTPEKRPTSTKLLDEVYALEGRRTGAAAYQMLSAFAHGTLYAMMRMLRPIVDENGAQLPRPADGMTYMQVATDAPTEALAVLSGLLPYNEAARRYWAWTGRDEPDWREHLIRCGAGARRFLPGGSDEGPEVPPL